MKKKQDILQKVRKAKAVWAAALIVVYTALAVLLAVLDERGAGK